MKTDLVVAAYIIHDGKLLLIHHKKHNMWLPPGGHIEPNETPDEAIKREVKEEVGLDIEIMGQSNIPMGEHAKKNLAIPFHINVHSVGDHDHCCLFYLCKPSSEKITIKKDELNNAKWFTKDEIKQDIISTDVHNIATKAFEKHENR